MERPQILRRATKGFTLIEISVVIVVVTLIAALMMPNIMAMKSSREARNFLSAIRDLSVRARTEALNHGETMAMTMDPTNQQLTVAVDSTETDADKNIASLKVPEGTTLQTYKIGTEDSNDASWKVHFYPDGRSEGGGFEINQANAVQAFMIREDGSNRMLMGNYPDLTSEKWQAGDYVKRQ